MARKYSHANRRMVYDYIKGHSEGVLTSQIVEDLGMPTNEVRSHVMRLCNDGDIVFIGRVESGTKIWRTRW